MTVCNGHQNCLHHRLGAWIEPYASTTLSNWRWFWDAHNNDLYHDCASYWEHYKGRQSQRTRGGYSKFSTCVLIPIPPTGLVLIRTSVEKKGDHILMTDGSRTRTSLEYIEEQDEEEMELPLAVNSKKAVLNLGMEQWAARVVYMTDSLDDIVHGLQDATLIGVSDGSFKNKRGSSC